MASRLYIVVLAITFCVSNAIPSNGQKGTNNIKYDTAKTAIIPFDQKANYPFDNSYKPAALTQSDINNVDSLLIACVNDYNASLDNEHKLWVIDLKKYDYRKQLVVVTNRKGEKEVWVNCFCNTWDKKWKSEMLLVKDGGNCYFNFKIILTTKKFYDLLVNGEA